MTEDEAVELLTKIGLRSTPVRRAILVLLSATTQPMDVPALLEKLPKQTDGVTVYRTLNSFVEKKIIHRVRGEERSWSFAMGPSSKGAAHRHAHFVCEQCGKVECLAELAIPRSLGRGLNVGPKYNVDYTEVIVHGSCGQCH